MYIDIFDTYVFSYKLYHNDINNELTITHKSASSFLNVMKIARSILKLNLQSFKVKLCAVAVNG